MNNKVGRNDPCPCGSGKKYKTCCQQKHTLSAQQTASPDINQVLREGWIYYQQGRFSEAEVVCQRVLKIKPKQADALHLLGIIALQNGDINKAILHINRAIKINPANPEYHNNLGFALHEQGKLIEAARHYRTAINIEPAYTNALYNQHALLLCEEGIEPAVRNMQKVVELQPNDVDARFTLGVLLDYSGNDKAALSQFEIVRQSAEIYRSRLDAWEYLRSKGAKSLPMMGSMIDTFKLAMHAANTEGLVLEFGVRFANSIRQIAALAGANQLVHGFDSFEGLPEVWHHEPKGSYTTKGEIPSVPANVKLHTGWFEDTLPEFLQKHDGNVRFINIDCDIYSSTKTVLDLLGSRIVPGTVIVFDEYIGNEHWREDEFKAFQEAVANNGWNYEYLCFSIFTKQIAVRILE